MLSGTYYAQNYAGIIGGSLARATEISIYLRRRAQSALLHVIRKMEEAAKNSKNEVVVSECPVINVVVYKDRAEVTREISLQLESGAQEVALTPAP